MTMISPFLVKPGQYGWHQILLAEIAALKGLANLSCFISAAV
jgi:hypothetical protein